MKKRWEKFVSLVLGKTTLESSADGVFVSEEDMDKFMALHTENETVKGDLATKTKELTDATAAKDTLVADHKTAIDKLTTEKKVSDDALEAANQTIATQKTKIEEQAAKILGKPVQRKSPAEAIETGNTDEKYSYTKKYGFKKPVITR